MGSTLHFQTHGTFWCSGLAPRLNTAFKNKPSAAKGKAKHTGFLLRKQHYCGVLSHLLHFSHFFNQKACWEEVLVILNSENRLVHLKPLAKKRMDMSWILTIVVHNYSQQPLLSFNYVALKVCGTLQTNEEHRDRQFQYSTLSFSAHCWFPLRTKSGKWPGNSLQAPTQSLFWFPIEELDHWNLCQVQGFPLSQLCPAAGRDHWMYTKYIHCNSSSLYRFQAIAIKPQDKISQKAVSAFTRKNTQKMCMLSSRMSLFMGEGFGQVCRLQVRMKSWEPRSFWV